MKFVSNDVIAVLFAQGWKYLGKCLSEEDVSPLQDGRWRRMVKLQRPEGMSRKEGRRAAREAMKIVADSWAPSRSLPKRQETEAGVSRQFSAYKREVRSVPGKDILGLVKRLEKVLEWADLPEGIYCLDEEIKALVGRLEFVLPSEERYRERRAILIGRTVGLDFVVSMLTTESELRFQRSQAILESRNEFHETYRGGDPSDWPPAVFAF